MNKRITSILLCIVMIASMLVTAVPAFAVEGKSTTFKLTADKTEAEPGDTITFTVSMGAVDGLKGLGLDLRIPSGLTFVSGSGKVTDGLMATMAAANIMFTESSKIFMVASCNYTSAADTVLMTFQCKVDDGTSGNKTVELGLVDDDPDNCCDLDYDNIAVTFTPATVNVTIPHVHVYDKETLDYLVSPATCTSPAVYHKSCACGAEGTETFTYGSALGHDYTQKFEDAAHLKTAASKCTEHNIYWYDCSRCDSNAKNDPEAADKYFSSATTGSHSFTERIEDAAHYVAGTGTDCQSVKKYYYDCAYCDQIGTTTWDSTTYGPHDYATVWSSDETGHWHECSLCHAKDGEATHTPDREAATETDPIKCTECDYIITPALGHTHRMTLVAASPATCTADGNIAYYVCSGCSKWFEDATGNVEITDHNSVVIGHPGHDWKDATCTAPKTCSRCDATEGTPLGHDFADVWSSDASGHWHACSRCDAKDGEAAHTPDREAATETDPIKCTECDYVITAALGMQDYTVEMPVCLAVKLTGDEKPAKETFKFEIYDLGYEDTEFEILNDTVVAENVEFDENGVAFLYGFLKIKVVGEEQLCNLTEGFKVRMVKGSTKGWTYAPEQWCVELFFENDALDVNIGVKEIVDGEISEVYANGMSFAVSYEAVSEPSSSESGKPENPDSPQTGDNSMMGLWIALLFVSGAGVAGTTVYSRKKKYSVK